MLLRLNWLRFRWLLLNWCCRLLVSCLMLVVFLLLVVVSSLIVIGVMCVLLFCIIFWFISNGLLVIGRLMVVSCFMFGRLVVVWLWCFVEFCLFYCKELLWVYWKRMLLIFIGNCCYGFWFGVLLMMLRWFVLFVNWLGCLLRKFCCVIVSVGCWWLNWKFFCRVVYGVLVYCVFMVVLRLVIGFWLKYWRLLLW